MEKPRILIINDYQKVLGGVERYLNDLIPSLELAGFPVTRINIENLVSDNSNLSYRLYNRYSKRFSDLLYKQIIASGADVVHLHNNKLATRSVLDAVIRSDLPVIQSIHDLRQIQELPRKGHLFKNMSSFFYNKNSQWQENAIDTYISHSLYIKNSISVKYPASSLQHIPLYVNRADFSPSSSENRTNTLLYVGRLEPDKGVAFLVDTFLKTKLKDDFTLHIHGNGSLTEWCREVTKESERIRFFENSSMADIEEAYQSAFCTIVPSIWQEPFGLVGLESQSCGTPVIASKVGGIHEWCIHRETGLMFQSEDSNSLLEEIYFLKDHPELGKMCAENALKRLDTYFSKENHITTLINLYQESLNS